MIVRTALFCITAVAVHCRLIPISDEDATIRQSLARCIAAASEQYFSEFEILTVSLAPNLSNTKYSQSSSLDGMLLPELFSKEKWSVLLKQPQQGRPLHIRSYLNYRRSDSYLLQLRSWLEINIHLMYLKKQTSWNPHAKFIVISVMLYDNIEQIVEYLIKKMWKQDILNGVVVFPDPNMKAVFNIYSWFPFADGSCGDQYNKIEKIGTCYFEILKNQKEWFANKIPNKMNNCSLKVRTFSYPPFIVKPERIEGTNYYRINKGLEAQMLNMLSETANFYMQYEIVNSSENWGEFNRINLNMSTGIVGGLYRGEVDIGIASMSATSERNAFLDPTSAYFQDSIGFCVPHAAEQTQWRKLVGIMTTAIWIGIVITQLVITVITKALSNKDEKLIYRDYGGVAMKLVAILVGNAINIQPTTMQVRLFLFLWIIFSLHLDTAYQTYLMSTLTKPQYGYQIKDVQDIIDSNLEILLMPSTANYFSGTDTSKYSTQTQEIMKRFKDCEFLDDCLKRTAYKRDCVIAASRLYIKYARSSYISKNGHPLLYCLEDAIVTYPVVAYMRRGFPMQGKFDNAINAINSAGFLQSFEEHLFQKKKFAEGFKNDSYSEDDFLDVDKTNLLTLEYLHPIFLMLFMGYSVSSFVYLLEILVSK